MQKKTLTILIPADWEHPTWAVILEVLCSSHLVITNSLNPLCLANSLFLTHWIWGQNVHLLPYKEITGVTDFTCQLSYCYARLVYNAVLSDEGFCFSLKYSRLFSQIPVINDDLPMKILSGAVIIKPNVKEICGCTVVFDDGSTVEKVREEFSSTFSKIFVQWRLSLIPYFFVVTGGHYCICHRVQLWFPLLAKKCHVQVWAPCGSVQACFPPNPRASYSGCRGFHSCPWSHHASGWNAGPLGYSCLQR